MIYAYNLIAFPLTLVVMGIYLYRYFKKNQNFGSMDEMLEIIEMVKPHCFFIDFFLIGFSYIYFVN